MYSAQQDILQHVYSEEWLGQAIEILFYIYLFCTYGHKYHGACMEVKDNLKEAFLSFNDLESESWTQVGGKCLYSLSHLASPVLTYYCINIYLWWIHVTGTNLAILNPFLASTVTMIDYLLTTSS